MNFVIYSQRPSVESDYTSFLDFAVKSFGMKSTAPLVLLAILLCASHGFSLVNSATDSTCSLSTTKNDESTKTEESKKSIEIAITEKKGRFGISDICRCIDCPYSPDIEVLWKITVPENYEVILEFQEPFELESDEQCRHDYLELRDGHEPDSPLLERLCGDRSKTIRSSGNKLLAKLVTNESIQKMGFEAKFRAGTCRTIIHSAQGTFRSTNYPHEYSPLSDCTWKIVALENHVIILGFRSFEVENEDRCAYDYVEIRNGPENASPLLGRLCGEKISEHFHFSSSSNVMTVRFVTDGSVQKSGFEAEFSTVLCGGDIEAGKGKIMSYNHLGRYLPNMDCVWNIVAGENQRVSLKFKSFELDSQGQCDHDYVEIRDGAISNGALIGKFCGRVIPEYIVSTGNQLSVRFVSNERVEKAGFVAEYTSKFCIQDVSSGSGNIKNSFFYNSQHKPNTECIWRITGPDDEQIGLKLNKLKVESHEQCIFDYVAIFDGYNLKSSLLGKFCGDRAPEESIVSSRNKMVVKFITDESFSDAGFAAKYTTLKCGPPVLSVIDQLQNFSTPGHPLLYPKDMTCSWNFHITKPLYKVKMRFTDIDIPCTDDSYIEINTLKEVNLPYRICGNTTEDMHDVLSTGDVSIKLHSGSSGKGRGFRLDYGIADCQVNYTKDNGLLLSPKYPDPYLPHWRCATSIETSPDRTISLYFGSFIMRRRDITRDALCEYANLKVYDGQVDQDTMIANVCGSSTPNPVFSSTNKIIMVMRTYENTDALYSLSYTTTDKGRGCGGVLRNTNGTFTSPLYPEAYRGPRSCMWYLSVPSLHSMSLHFSFYEMSSTAGCTTNYVELYEGRAEIQSKKVYRRCGKDLPATYKSHSNELMLKLVADETNHGSGFVAHFNMNRYEA